MDPSLGAAAVLDEAAIAMLRATVPDLFRYASRLTGGDRWLAEDLVQEACLALVRQGQGGADAGDVTAGWLVVVVRRRYLDHLRRTQREKRRLRLAGVSEESADEVDADWQAVSGVEALALLGEIPADQRVALVLRYVDDLPVREVAALLQRSVAATESLLARGRRELARRVKGGGNG